MRKYLITYLSKSVGKVYVKSVAYDWEYRPEQVTLSTSQRDCVTYPLDTAVELVTKISKIDDSDNWNLEEV